MIWEISYFKNWSRDSTPENLFKNITTDPENKSQIPFSSFSKKKGQCYLIDSSIPALFLSSGTKTASVQLYPGVTFGQGQMQLLPYCEYS